MKVITIAIDEIEVQERLRPVTESLVKALAANIEREGLRLPIEVRRRRGGTWVLVAGAHRLAACRLLGHETIPALEWTGTAQEMRRREVMENLARNELTQVERAQYVAAAQRAYQEENPESRRGGYDRSLK